MAARDAAWQRFAVRVAIKRCPLFVCLFLTTAFDLNSFHPLEPTMFFPTPGLPARRTTAISFTALSAAPTVAWRVFAALLAVVCLSTANFLMTDPVVAQALAPVVRSATIIRDTVVAIALLVMTAAVGIAGFRVAFTGASFRDVSSLLVGGALAGGAAAIAAIFVV
jgi:hypothetical protein